MFLPPLISRPYIARQSALAGSLAHPPWPRIWTLETRCAALAPPAPKNIVVLKSKHEPCTTTCRLPYMKPTPPGVKVTFFPAPSAQTYLAHAAVVPVETPCSTALGLTSGPWPPE